MIVSARSASSIGSARLARRRSGTRLVAPESFASVLERVEAAQPSADVAPGPAPLILGTPEPGDRAVLAQFLADLAAAPQIVGELVALYVEQHPRLGVWFAARAAAASTEALRQIEAAARWREVCGAAALAELIRAAVAIACPPADPEPAPPSVILDLDWDLDDYGLGAL